MHNPSPSLLSTPSYGDFIGRSAYAPHVVMQSFSSSITTGTNTGDETAVTIKSKLGITTLSGSNTGDQTITLTGGVTGSGTGSFAVTVVTNANLTGEVTSAGNASTLTNSAVISKVLTGYSSGPGAVAATDTILQSIQKLNGNDALKALLGGSSSQAFATAALSATTISATGAITTSAATGLLNFTGAGFGQVAATGDLYFDTGTGKNVHIRPNGGSEVALFSALGLATTGIVSATGVIQTGGYTVATLPAGVIGMQAYVTDALTPAFLTIVVGGGATKAPVFYNGTNWVGG
jgi:hypothetical protein